MDNDDLKRTYELAETSEKISKQQLDRAQKLLLSKFISQQQYDEKNQKWSVDNTNLIKAKKDYEDSIFKATFDGKLGLFQVKEGSYLKSGTAIVSLFNPHNLIISIDIPEKIVSRINASTKTFINNKQFKISSVQNVINQETRMGEAKIEIEDADSFKGYAIGSQIEVQIVVESLTNVLVIPKSAVFIRDDDYHVFVVEGEKAILKKVKLGKSNNELVEIIEGLRNEDLVISIGQSRIYPDDIVRVYK